MTNGCKNLAQETLSHFFDENVEPGPPRRIVAVGDLHGDLQNTFKVLEFAAVINERHEWIAPNTTLVQIGDVVDRGRVTKFTDWLSTRISRFWRVSC